MGKQIGGERKREGVRTAPGCKGVFGPRPYRQSGENRQAEWKWWRSSGREGSVEEEENPRGRTRGVGGQPQREEAAVRKLLPPPALPGAALPPPGTC